MSEPFRIDAQTGENVASYLALSIIYYGFQRFAVRHLLRNTPDPRYSLVGWTVGTMGVPAVMNALRVLGAYA